MEAKAIKKPLQKNIKKMMPKMSPSWSQRGSQIGAKIVKSLGSTLLQGWLPSGLQTPSRIDFGEVLGPFWDHVRQFFSRMFGDFYMHYLAACCKQKRSKEQGITKRIQQRASKKQLLSQCHLALNSSLANVNELSGPCQYRLRQDRCLLWRLSLNTIQLSCLNSRHLSCLSSRHLSCLNSRHQHQHSSLSISTQRQQSPCPGGCDSSRLLAKISGYSQFGF